MVRGTVTLWDSASGKGLIATPELPGEVQAEESVLRGRHRSLNVGDAVLFDYEPTPGLLPGFRAVWVKARAVSA